MNMKNDREGTVSRSWYIWTTNKTCMFHMNIYCLQQHNTSKMICREEDCPRKINLGLKLRGIER